MSAAADQASTGRIFGVLAIILFLLFVLNVLVAKLSIINQWAIPRVPNVIEFLVLLFAAGCFVAYAASSHTSNDADAPD